VTTSSSPLRGAALDDETGLHGRGRAELDAGYEALEEAERIWIAEGRTPSGWKIGLTSRPAQQRFGAARPCFGRLFADMSAAAGSTIGSDRFEKPRVEAEVAFEIGRDLSPGQPLVEAVVAVMPAIEIVDSRHPKGPPSLGALIADNVSAAGYVLGPATEFDADLDLARCSANILRNGAFECAGSGAECLGSPLRALDWLARELDRRGRRLRAGEIVLSGSLIVPFAAFPGDTVEVGLESIGTVSISFSGEA
jgi:2-keto-4-pentenoate hydratase